jgi:hypothetical protein
MVSPILLDLRVTETLHRHFPTYTVVTLRNVQRKSNFAQVKIEYSSQLRAYRLGISTHWNLIGRRMSAPSHALSPISILPPSLSQFGLIPRTKNSARILKMLFRFFFP